MILKPKKIVVGSDNPVKIDAARLAVSAWQGVEVEGKAVQSGVAGQPMTDAETRLGARQRAKSAWEIGVRDLTFTTKTGQNIILGVGLEGGVFRRGKQLWSTVWACVTADGLKFWESNGARFPLPEVIAQPILDGQEMGDVLSLLFGGEDIKRQQGGIGVLTQNFITRTEEYSSIAKLAIGLWYGQNWQKNLSLTKRG